MAENDIKRRGFTHLYFGDGKGKTTAAAGLALRAINAGMSVFIVQFLKNRASGEMQLLGSFAGVTILRGKCGAHFSAQMTAEEREKTKMLSDKNFMSAVSAARAGFCELLILDELCAAWNENLINHSLVQKFLEHKPENVEIVITGRNPSELFVKSADYCTEFKKIAHPFDCGVSAREGIEY
ncbi:MAG: cob(I)yrinic acid a,c-diamide adenosyltransferase [Spirochaetaceae bacterium]|nr:cob(I)yrinic acid a,c-diamide adenosyltransferase [Spirochaetaceae bacterium]